MLMNNSLVQNCPWNHTHIIIVGTNIYFAGTGVKDDPSGKISGRRGHLISCIKNG